MTHAFDIKRGETSVFSSKNNSSCSLLQAPDSLKSVVQAIWLLTVSFKFVVHCYWLLTH